jgi:hypothetical protein
MVLFSLKPVLGSGLAAVLRAMLASDDFRCMLMFSEDRLGEGEKSFSRSDILRDRSLLISVS